MFNSWHHKTLTSCYMCKVSVNCLTVTSHCRQGCTTSQLLSPRNLTNHILKLKQDGPQAWRGTVKEENQSNQVKGAFYLFLFVNEQNKKLNVLYKNILTIAVILTLKKNKSQFILQSILKYYIFLRFWLLWTTNNITS